MKINEMDMIMALCLLGLVSLSGQVPSCSFPKFNMENVTRQELKYWKVPSKDVVPKPLHSINSTCSLFLAFCKPMNFLLNAPENQCQNVGGCMKCDSNGKDIKLYSLGLYNTSTVTTNTSEITFHYLNGMNVTLSTSCKLQTIVKLRCNHSAPWPNLSRDLNPTTPKPEKVIFDKESCTLTISLPYSGVCAQVAPEKIISKPDSGLSAGSILLIIFFVCLAIYLIGGISYNFINGAFGVELIPNYELWRAFPGYVVDGASFFFKFITCRPTERDSYDSI